MLMTAHEFSFYVQQMSPLASKGLTAIVQRGDETGLSPAAVPGLLMVSPDAGCQTKMAKALDALDGADKPLTDPAGHRRPIYLPLATHLFLSAWLAHMKDPWPTAGDDLASPMLQAMEAPMDDPTKIDLHLWQSLCVMQLAMLRRDEGLKHDVIRRVDQLIAQPGPAGSLHRQDPEESLDAWTYRELVGLHALFDLSVIAGRQGWRSRCDGVAAHHLENSQPDNTTSQPWGVSAFASHEQGRSFAEQQLHDSLAQGHGHVVARPDARGPGLVACLLLADAIHMLTKLSSQA